MGVCQGLRGCGEGEEGELAEFGGLGGVEGGEGLLLGFDAGGGAESVWGRDR